MIQLLFVRLRNPEKNECDILTKPVHQENGFKIDWAESFFIPLFNI